MPSAKQLIRSAITRTGLHRVTEVVLVLAGAAVLAAGRAVAWAYARAWPLFGRPWFDHRFSHLVGPHNWQWSERGIAAAALIGPDHDVLELACGDGFYAALFFAPKARHVDAMDVSPHAIARARRRHSRPSLQYHLADVLADPFPLPAYDVVCCFGTFQYFSPAEAALLLAKVGRAIAQRGGCFVGSVPIYPAGVIDSSAKVNFAATDQVRQMLEAHFGQVRMWSTRWGIRTDEYFVCSGPRAAT